jgi:hypothetical protein
LHCVLVLLRRHGAEDEIAVVLHLPFLEHCESASMNSQRMKLRQREKQVKDHGRAQKHSRAEVKPKTFVQSGHGIPPISAAQASSATAHPSTRGHTKMLRYSSTMSRVLYLRVNRRSIMMNSSPSGQEGSLVYDS